MQLSEEIEIITLSSNNLRHTAGRVKRFFGSIECSNVPRNTTTIPHFLTQIQYNDTLKNIFVHKIIHFVICIAGKNKQKCRVINCSNGFFSWFCHNKNSKIKIDMH